MAQKKGTKRRAYIKKVGNEKKGEMKQQKCIGGECDTVFITDNKYNKLCKICKDRFYF